MNNRIRFKVYCPYCDEEMILWGLTGNRKQYKCLGWSCGASSPIGNDVEDAYNKAIRRQLQSPLKIDDAIEVRRVVVETKNGTIFGMCLVHLEGGKIFIDDIHRDDIRLSNYGATWRCWEHFPSEAERVFAKWS